MLKFILYMLLAVVILSGGIFKTFAINYGISKYLSKKPYKGDFEFKKVALHTLKTNYILLALVVLIVLGITLCSASSYINIVDSRKFSRIDFRIFYCTCNVSFRSMVQCNR